MYKDNENLRNPLNFDFLTNNVKRIQSTKKQLKLWLFKNEMGLMTGILFFQGTHSSTETEMKWIEDYFSPDKTNSCDILVAIYYNLNFYDKYIKLMTMLEL